MDWKEGSREEIHKHYPPINKQGALLHVAVHGGLVWMVEGNSKRSDSPLDNSAEHESCCVAGLCGETATGIMSVYGGEEHTICVVGLCVSIFLPTTRRGTCRSACGQWNHVNESWKTWHQVSKHRFPAFPRPRRPVRVPFHEEHVSLFCERSLLWQLKHLHLSIS